MASRSIVLVLLGGLAGLVTGGCDDAGTSAPAPPPPAPSTSAPSTPAPSRPAASHFDENTAGIWRCPDHESQMNSVRGECPDCGRAFELTPTALVWVCLEHPVILRDQKGLCAICERSLKPLTMARVWTCPDHEEAKSNRPGTCGGCGFELEEELESIPHGDHNPRHGGQFFMAPDLWHHLEGTMPVAGEFRVYLYDDFTEPLDARRATGSIAHRTAPEDESEPPRTTMPLSASEDGEYLVARIPAERAGFPLEVRATLSFASNPEDSHAFDFYFEDITREEKAKTGAVQELAQTAGAVDSEPIDWSGTSDEKLVEELEARAAAIDELIERQRWTELYRPAIEAKDIALALQARLAKPERRVDWAIRELVRGAWLLELHGDAGNGEKVRAAHAVFERGREALAQAKQ